VNFRGKSAFLRLVRLLSRVTTIFVTFFAFNLIQFDGLNTLLKICSIPLFFSKVI